MLFRAICATALLLSGSTAHAQTDYPDELPPSRPLSTVIDEKYDWAARVDSGRAIAPLGDALFGDATSYYDGSTSFTVTDVDLPGNNALPVNITRMHRASDPQGFPTAGMLGEWDLELPHVRGTFARTQGWQVDTATPNQRCSVAPAFRNPPTAISTDGGAFGALDFWSGNTLSIPGAGDQQLLVRTPENTNVPTDSAAYFWTTRDYWQVRCVAALANGVGEGFEALSPAGTRYRFDWEIRRPQKTLIKHQENGMGGVNYFLDRDEVRLYATEVTDRFGNWVRYSYTGDRLTRILASDGREITLTHYTTGANAGLIETVNANARTWLYEYAGGVRRLTAVQLPDASRWTLTTQWLELSYLTPPNLPPCDLAPTRPDALSYQFVHPSGAIGVFTFTPVRHRRGGIPQTVVCRVGAEGVEQGVARDFDVYALSQKTLSGPSLTPLQWQLTFAPQAFNQLSKAVTLNLPDGSSQRMVFGTAYYIDEAKLKVNQVFSSAPSTLLTQTAHSYADHPPAPVYAYQVGLGPDTKLLDEFAQAYAVPIQRTETIQQGVSFVRTVTAFDRFARATTETQASGLGFSRTKSQSYEDRFDSWVIGLPRVTTVAGINQADISYDSAGLPEQRSEYGQLIASYTYASDGTLSTAKDGLNQITTLSSWQRGYPQRLDFSDTTFKTAVIDDNGWITSITNELGDKSCFGYDGMGRLTSQTLPSETSVGVCDASAWTPTTWQFAQVNSAEYGVESGHWKRTESTGARSMETFYDALWRPIFTRQSSTDASASVRTLRRSFDHAGREVFASYPNGDVANYLTLATGVRTGYDGLGRVLNTEADSELTPAILRSSTAYLANFISQTTNARGFATTTSYQAFEQPSTDAPLQISAPESQITTYTRDVFGKPITMTRSGSYTPPGGTIENQSLTRSFVYDDFQRLCKSIEPESGVTVLDYDAANNVQWQALAQNTLTSTSNCQRSSVPAAQRSVNYFDARNRLTRIDHPTGSDDLGYSYETDGAVQTASIGTLDSAVPPNFTSIKNSWTYGYNKRRLLTTETLDLDSNSFALSWRYNARGDQEGLIYPSGLDISFLPNAYGEPQQASSFASSVTRHPNGAINSLTYGNTLVQTTTQNLRQLPLRRTVGTLMDHTHLYDENANIVTLTDGSAGNAESRNLAYDGLDRMITANAPAQLGNESYSFDALDNLRRASIGSNTFVHTLDSQNRLSQIQKDGAAYVNYSQNAQGDTTLRSFVGIPSENIFANGFENPARAPEFASNQVLNFDRAHRLTSITGVESYQYDAHGRRVITTRTSDGLKRYQLYSNAGVLMHTEDQRTSEVIDYVNLEGQLVAERSQPLFGGLVTTRYQHADLRGSPTVVSSAGGTQIERSIEQPFGAPYDGIYRDGPGFTGHATDAASGLTYMQQRYYDPIAMRFLSVDPAEANSGIGFSRYAYAANNPFKNTDPDGRATQLIFNLNGNGSSNSSNGGSSSGSKMSGSGGAGHVGMRVDRGYQGKPYLYDPGGDYKSETIGTGQAASGEEADLQSYVDYQLSDGPDVYVIELKTTESEEANMGKRIEDAGGKSGGLCANTCTKIIDNQSNVTKDMGSFFLPRALFNEMLERTGQSAESVRVKSQKDRVQ